MKFPHSLKFLEIPGHVRRPARLLVVDHGFSALEEPRFQLLPAHRLAGMTARRRLDLLKHPTVFEANGDAGVEVLEAAGFYFGINHVAASSHHLLHLWAQDHLIPELGGAHLAPQNGDCQEEWERE